MKTLKLKFVQYWRAGRVLLVLLVSMALLTQPSLRAQEITSQTLLAPVPDVAGPQHEKRESKLSNDDKKRWKYDVSRIGNRPVGKGLNFYSVEAERVLGRQFADAVEEQAKTIDDPAINNYMDQLCQRLIRHSDAKFPFRVRVLQNDEINAFALPGGYLYVNSGLILSVDNEAELAAVIAHEIGHVTARHASRNATKSQIWNLASIPLVFVSGPAGMALQQIKGFAVPLTFLKFSRDAEREADMLGLQYQYAAGYDPATFVSFFEKLKTKKQGFLAKAFSTHPMNEERIRSAQREIDTMLPMRDEYVVTSSAFEDAKVRLATIISGKPPVDGQTEDKPVLMRAANSRPEQGPQPQITK